jgi:class 3 adenylate cyclase/esterase/lipase
LYNAAIMEPRIQYAQTSDDVNIAYFSMGEGLPVVFLPPVPWSHLQLELADPGYRRWFEANSRSRRLIRYDNRGSGSSDRRVENMALEDFLLDIDAVVDKLGLEQFVLCGISIGGPIAIAYASRYPERVSKLALWCSPARWEDVANPQGEALKALRETDWSLFTETVAHAMVAGWGSSDEARTFATLMRESIEPDIVLHSDLMEWRYDLSGDLIGIQCPTLVVHRRECQYPDISAARYIAARVPNAELVVLEGGALLPWIGDMDAVVRTIDRFLGIEPVTAEAPKGQPRPRAAGLATILFTDIEGSTLLTQRAGDATAQEVVRAHNAIVRDALGRHGGTEIKHTGDGIMASFPLASSALQAAIDIQLQVERYGEEHPDSAFRVSIGLNAGEPVVEEQDLYGTAVQLAARICSQAEGGEILVSNVVRELAAGKGFLFSDRGVFLAKGFDEPVHVFEIEWRHTTAS